MTADPRPLVDRGLTDPLLERITDAFIALDRDWRVVYMNSAAMGLNARPRPDVIGRSHWEEWPETLGSEVERQYRLAMETQRPVHFEHHYVRPGLDFWHSIHAYPGPDGLSIFYRDITAEKRAEALSHVLADAGARLSASLDLRTTLRDIADLALPLLGQWAVAYLLDDQRRVTAVRCAAIDERQRRLVKRVVELLPAVIDDAPAPLRDALDTGEAVLVSPVGVDFYDALTAPGLREAMVTLAPLSLLSVPLIARGSTIGGIIYGASITGRSFDESDVRAARELAIPAALALDNARLFEAERHARLEADQARIRAEEANRSKVDFLRVMSHELRTPLNAIGGYAQLLLMGVRGPISEMHRHDVERISRNHTHATSLIDDVLHFARLEMGRVEFDCKPIAIVEVLDQLEGYVAPQMAEGDRRLTVARCDPGLTVVADPAKTTQIIVNLMGNALKHTPAGTVVQVFTFDDPADARVDICVRDNGPGIGRAQHETIFRPFVQIGRETHHPVEGLGLGLAIARDLARGMGGELTVDSEEGAGAVFTLSLPRVPEPPRHG